MSEFRYSVDLSVRFRDLDPMGHVNNAVYASYLEHARAGYFVDVLDRTLAAVPTALVSLDLDYHSPIEPDDDVTVALRVPGLGGSSVPMEYEVRAGEAVAATAETVQVAVDPDTGDARPVPGAWRRAIRSFEGL